MSKKKHKKTAGLILSVFLLAVLCWAGWQAFSEQRADRPGPDEGSILHEAAELEVEAEGEEPVKDLSLQYFGHSCFLMDIDGFRILMDPFSPQVGYGALEKEVELVTISHEHMDHNYAEAAPGAQVLRGLTPDGLGWETISYSVGNVSISSIPSYHDEASGKLRGRNTIFVFDIGELRVVHLGDLGHLLNDGDLEKLSPVDVLLIPVGGHYTIDALEAMQVVEQLVPAVVIPMHYQTRVTRNWPIAGLDNFFEGEEIIKEKGNKPVSICKDKLPETTEVWVLEPAKLRVE